NPNINLLARAMNKLDLIVVTDLFLTDTARMADIILPATSMFEYYDLITGYGHSYIQLQQKLIEPPDECKHESEMYRLLGKKFGFNLNYLPENDLSTIEKIIINSNLNTNVDELKEKIERCLEAARLAPSASNSQPWRFIVADNPKLKEEVAKETFSQLISFNRFSLQAPVLIVLISERPGLLNKVAESIKDKQFSLIDIGIAAEHFCLQAAEEGLGTCMLGWFNEKGVKKLLNIPPSKRVELVITVGYPESTIIRPKKRKP
ncbi:unnamed protein product, partial [marine sediment metagenome]